MLPDLDELARRAHHLAGLLFTDWTAIGLALGLVAWAVGARVRLAAAREALLVALSLGMLAWLASLPVAALWVLYAFTFRTVVEHGRPRWLAGLLVVLLLAAMVILPVWFVGPIGAFGRHARALVAFGTSIALLRFHAYAWDRWAGRSEREPPVRFLLAMFFFPTFVNGPVEVPRQLASGWGPVTGRDALAGLGRVAAGVAKLLAVGLGLPPAWTAGLTGMSSAPAYQLWLWGALLYVWFYLSFSAWTDVAVGLGRLCGRRVQENFSAPWAALDLADFWRRWHISLGLWLRDYVYIPLGGNRRHRVANVLAVFVVSAAWHVWGSLKLLGLVWFPPYAWGGFFLWGAFNAAGVIAAGPLARAVPTAGAWRAPRRIATFVFASFCWMPFFFPSELPFTVGLRMLLRMVWPWVAIS